ncbi:MAG: CcmD family protein [Polyangiaceae bacterium]|jgi:hypothetical protein
MTDIVGQLPAATPSASPSATSTSSPDDRSTSFEAVQGNAREQYSGGTLLVAAYAALWVVLFAWVAIVWRKQGALSSRLADLERVLDRAAADAAKADAKKKPEES